MVRVMVCARVRVSVLGPVRCQSQGKINANWPHSC